MVRLCGICRQAGHNRKTCPVPVIDLDTPPSGVAKLPQAQAQSQSRHPVSVQPRSINPGAGLGSGLVQGMLKVKAEPVDDWGMNAPQRATDIPQSIAGDTTNVSMPAPVVTTVSTLGYTPHAAPTTLHQPSPAELFSNSMQCRVCKESGHDHFSCPLLRQAIEHKRNADYHRQQKLTHQANLSLAQPHEHAKVLASTHPVPPPPTANKPYVITFHNVGIHLLSFPARHACEAIIQLRHAGFTIVPTLHALLDISLPNRIYWEERRPTLMAAREVVIGHLKETKGWKGGVVGWGTEGEWEGALREWGVVRGGSYQPARRNVAQGSVKPGAEQQWMVTQGCLYTYTNSDPATLAPAAAPCVQLATQPITAAAVEHTTVQTAGQSSRGANVVGPAPPPPSSELDKNTSPPFSGYDALSSATTAPLSEALTSHHPIKPLEHPPSSRETSQAPSAPAAQLSLPAPKVAKQKMSREEAIRRKREQANAYRRRLAPIPVSKPEAASTSTPTSTVPGIPTPALDPNMKVPTQPEYVEPAWSNERISSKLSDAAVAAAKPRPRYPAYVPPTPPNEEEIKDAFAKEGLRMEGGRIRVWRCGRCKGVGHNITTCPGIGVRRGGVRRSARGRGREEVGEEDGVGEVVSDDDEEREREGRAVKRARIGETGRKVDMTAYPTPPPIDHYYPMTVTSFEIAKTAFEGVQRYFVDEMALKTGRVDIMVGFHGHPQYEEVWVGADSVNPPATETNQDGEREDWEWVPYVSEGSDFVEMLMVYKK
ncbi:hypothetical protein YB2330_002342 [Saitoella coloradoensis]